MGRRVGRRKWRRRECRFKRWGWEEEAEKSAGVGRRQRRECRFKRSGWEEAAERMQI